MDTEPHKRLPGEFGEAIPVVPIGQLEFQYQHFKIPLKHRDHAKKQKQAEGPF